VSWVNHWNEYNWNAAEQGLAVPREDPWKTPTRRPLEDPHEKTPGRPPREDPWKTPTRRPLEDPHEKTPERCTNRAWSRVSIVR
jgi:hypothetical protein